MDHTFAGWRNNFGGMEVYKLKQLAYPLVMVRGSGICKHPNFLTIVRFDFYGVVTQQFLMRSLFSWWFMTKRLLEGH